MNLDSVRSLKADIFAKVFGYSEVKRSMVMPDGLPGFAHPRALEAAATGATFHAPEMDIAIGFGASGGSAGGSNLPDLQIVALVRNKRLVGSPILERINREARGELKVIATGPIRPQAFPLDRERPLRIGCSVGHVRSGNGSLGGFVKTPAETRAFLSNNHVLAWTNRGSRGDATLQPSRKDGGRDPEDRPGVLVRFVPIEFGIAAINAIDAALATVFPEHELSHQFPAGLPVQRPSGKVAEPRADAQVFKVGRQTIETNGILTITELDQVIVDYGPAAGRQSARFDGQMAISGAGTGAFSKPGDSGAIVFDQAGDGVGLLFAGSSTGGRNNRGLSFANPLAVVLRALDAELVV